MTQRYTRAKTLLRLAPWADTDLLREKTIEECNALVERWGDSVGAPFRERYDQFLTGECPTLPSSYDFEVAFVRVVREACRPYCDDQRFDAGKSELQKYFFRAAYWVND